MPNENKTKAADSPQPVPGSDPRPVPGLRRCKVQLGHTVTLPNAGAFKSFGFDPKIPAYWDTERGLVIGSIRGHEVVMSVHGLGHGGAVLPIKE